MNNVVQDLRYALRTMRLHLGFATIAVGALALGIGANTAIFSVVNAIMLRPLPYPDADRIVMIYRQYRDGRSESVTGTVFASWRDRSRVYDAVAAYDILGAGANLSGNGDPERVRSTRVTEDYFRVFGVAPALGRSFVREELQSKGPAVVVISDGLWKRRFGGDPAALGRRIVLNGQPHSIIGIMPPAFATTPAADVWTPLPIEPSGTDQANMFGLVARLKAGITVARAQTDSNRVLAEFKREYPGLGANYKNMYNAVVRYQDMVFVEVRPAVLVMLGAVALVLLIACANLANLLLARAAARVKEMAVRSAMGAGRGRLVRQLLTESLMLSFTGAALGLWVGHWGLRALLAVSPGDIPELAHIGVDWRVMLFAVLVAVFTGVLFGLAPALHAGRLDVADALKESGRGTSSGLRGQRVRGALVVAEVALSLVLLVGATLMMRSFVLLQSVQAGFDSRNVLTMQMSLADHRYQTSRGVYDFTHQVVQRIKALPGVQSAAMITCLPTEPGPDLPFEVEGRSGDSRSGKPAGDAQYRAVSPEFFRTLGVPLKAGRYFAETDAPNAAPVVIINDQLAKHFFKNTNPIGERITIGRVMGPPFLDQTRQIVGVVGDVKELGLHAPVPELVYLPAGQIPDAITALATKVLPTSWAVKTSVPPLSIAESVRREILAVDAAQPVANIRTMDGILSRSVAGRRFNVILLGVFAALALTLAVMGIYGVMSYAVTQRSHELGIRMALGATTADTIRMVLRESLVLSGIGAVIGIACALGLTRLLTRMLYGVRHFDPVTFVGVTAVLLVAALAASYVPARRATQVDPVNALRLE